MPCRSFRCLLLPCLLTACATAPPPPTLHQQLTDLAHHFHGRVGICVLHLATGDEVGIAENEVFPSASLIKVPILAALLAKVDAGDLDYHETLTYTRDRLYPGEDLLGAFTDGSTVALAKVAMLMITTSDNTAALWCQELAGGGPAINDWLARAGFVATRVNSRTVGREAAKAQFGWGQTTPREMCELLARMHAGTLVGAAASEEMQRCLSRVYWDAEALSQVPPRVHTLSKQGAIDRSRSEVVLVDAPHGAYVFCVITDAQQDTGWSHDNEGFVLLRDVSALLWRHFEPDLPYAPPDGMQRYW